ncbi:Coenzyme F420 hydrogenase/dehydrogenase, beta subunit C-terminal domain [Thermodesulfobacteriota bacterium]
MIDLNKSGQCKLIEKVIERGICVVCGACVDSCPYFSYFNGRVLVMDRCDLEEGRCLQFCPRVADERPHRETEPRKSDGTASLGSYRKIFMARAGDDSILQKAQAGGVVSAIIIYALENGFAESAVLTDRGSDLAPAGTLARNRNEILQNSGARYSGSAALASLNRALKKGENNLAVVGLPCQIEALSLMEQKQNNGVNVKDSVKLKVGLFCTWALDYRNLNQFLEKKGIDKQLEKYEISPPPSQFFRVLTGKEWQEFPLDDIRPFILKGCSLCKDMTAECADISVGTVEGLEGWSTVVVRSNRAVELVESAIEDKMIECRTLPDKKLKHLQEAALLKKKRGVEALAASF